MRLYLVPIERTSIGDGKVHRRPKYWDTHLSQESMGQVVTGVLQVSGTANSGTAVSLTDADLIDGNQKWLGHVLKITSGSLTGEQRAVVNWIPGTGTLVVSPAFSGVVGTDDYELRSGVGWGMMPFGPEDSAILIVPNALPDLTAEPDAFRLPLDLDQQIAGALTTVQDALEFFGFPGHWATGTMTYRKVMRTIMGMCQLFHRYQKLREDVINKPMTGITLETQWSSIPIAKRTDLKNAADALGLDTSSVVATTTVRQMLAIVGQQYENTTFYGGRV